jgi:hypothetical protein
VDRTNGKRAAHLCGSGRKVDCALPFMLTLQVVAHMRVLPASKRIIRSAPTYSSAPLVSLTTLANESKSKHS